MKFVENEEKLNLEIIAFTSLDVIDARVSKIKNTREMYVGTLYYQMDYRIYGYVTTSNYKFILIYKRDGTDPRESEIRDMFKKIHTSFTAAIINPLYESEATLLSKKFNQAMTSLIK
ncbi:hypothetical protein HZS_5623 [Henneguya salminicola]|nr:hypothetical protein HZS_5623 [Henneguya salminicola]